MKIVDLSNEVFLDLGEPSDISIASIAQKLRFSIGKLNLLLNTDFELSSSYEIVDENGDSIDINAAEILKTIYSIYYYSKKVNDNLGAAGIEVKEVRDDNAVVVVYDKLNISKSWMDLKKQSSLELQNLVNGYKVKKYRPIDVNGDDTIGYVNSPQTYQGYLYNGGL